MLSIDLETQSSTLKLLIDMAKVKWTIDPAHSEVEFKVKHLMITNVKGNFEKYDADIETEDNDFMSAKVFFTADIASVTTGNADRDAHIKSDDFFNANEYPQLKFVATGYEDVDHDGSYELYGDLTIRDVTQKVKLDVEYGGPIRDQWGNTRAGFNINGKISRKSYGLKWDVLTEAGGIVVSDEVCLHCNIQVVKQG
jgi:polyisoprenoid-binding protein YceI